MSREPIQHFPNGLDSWKREALGLVSDTPLALSSLALALLATASPFIFESQLPSWVFIDLFIFSFIFALYYLKWRSIRSLKIKFQLHMIAHTVRDKLIRFRREGGESLDIEDISNALCALVRDYFSMLTKCDRIGVAIRHTTKIDGKTAYVTKGRAGLNPNRAETSEPLYEDEGIARLFINRDARRGVYLIDNMKEAAKVSAFAIKENDKNYADEVVAMMFSPINGWDGEGKGLLGILYITTSKQGLFSEKLTDSVGFVADSLANVYSALVETQLTGDEDEPFRFRRS